MEDYDANTLGRLSEQMALSASSVAEESRAELTQAEEGDDRLDVDERSTEAAGFFADREAAEATEAEEM